MKKEVKSTHQDKLIVICAECGKQTELDQYEGWTFIIMKTFFCEKCKKLQEGKAMRMVQATRRLHETES